MISIQPVTVDPDQQTAVMKWRGERKMLEGCYGGRAIGQVDFLCQVSSEVLVTTAIIDRRLKGSSEYE